MLRLCSSAEMVNRLQGPTNSQSAIVRVCAAVAAQGKKANLAACHV